MDRRILPEFKQIDDFLEIDQNLPVIVLGDLDCSFRKDVLLPHLAQALAFTPLEDFSQVVNVVGHE